MSDELFDKRISELALRALHRGDIVFTRFLDMAQQTKALTIARHVGVYPVTDGGYPEAERRMMALCPAPDDAPSAWPYEVIRLSWRAQFGSPGHRDILGALMALGFERECTGDIVLGEGRAWLWAESDMASYIAASLTSCGRVSVSCEVTEGVPDLPAPKGKSVRDTVPSLRLDALIAAAFSVSRAEAARLISQGKAFIDQAQTLKADAQVSESALISVRGQGRFRLETVEGETKKGRIGVRFFIYGG